MSKDLDRLSSALNDLEGMGGLACEDCGASLGRGQARAAPLVAEPGDKRFSRIDILCGNCLKERIKQPTRH